MKYLTNNKQIGRCLFFLVIAIAIYFIALFKLIPFHPSGDILGIRNTGTLWHTLSWNIYERKYFLPLAILSHIEGPLQFLFLNAYYYLVGDIFPLNPATTHVPIAVLAFCCAMFCYLLGQALHSEKLGYFCALLFILSPWFAKVSRRPWIFNLLSFLFELATFYFYWKFVQEPDNRLYRIAAPVSLAFYLLGGLDWPAFLFILFVFMVLSKNWALALKNVSNLVPAVVIFTYSLFTGVVYYYETYMNSEKYFLSRWPELYKHTILTHPFFAAHAYSENSLFGFPLPGTIIKYMFNTFGLLFLLSLIGMTWYLARERSTTQSHVHKSFYVSMSVWLVIFSIPLFKVSFSVTHGYVIGLPVILFAALLLIKIPRALVVALLVTMVVFQGYTVTRDRCFDYTKDRRILAVAAFLLENRSDLLEVGKVSFVPGFEGRVLRDYTRGLHGDIFLEYDLTAYKYPPKTREFVRAYNEKGEIKADWLILPSELLTPWFSFKSNRRPRREKNKLLDFYERLASDSQIHWIACFQDQKDRKMWLGEVRPEGGTPIAQAPVYEVASFADLYEKKYYRISFLKEHVRIMFHW
jgi:hypothetical protein